MAQFQRIVISTVFIASTLALSACDGSGDGSTDSATGGTPSATTTPSTPSIPSIPVDPSILTGHFIDSPVAGLHYQTVTQSGLTNASGDFKYKAGETVTFSVGSISVGQALGASELTPFSLSGMQAPATQAEMEHLINVIGNGGLSPFSATINRATFLQSLDSDSNPDNGITLPAGLQTVFTQTHLNFSQDFDDFRNDLDVKVLRAATLAGVYPQLRKSRPSNLAVTKLFTGLGLTPHISQPSQYNEDLNNNGVTIAHTFVTYDSNGNQATFNQDNDGNTTIDYSQITIYDTNGNQIFFQRDGDGAGAGGITFRQRAEYTNGVQTLFQRDNDGDGLNPTVRDTFDLLGNITLHEVDTNGDSPGGVTYSETNTYDTYGNILTKSIDFNGDGSVVSVDTYSYLYDANKNILHQEMHNGTNSSLDTSYNATYDANNNLTTLRQFSNGTLDSHETFAYDTNDNLTTYTLSFNGIVTASIETYSYDTNGNQLTYNEDSNADGTIDYSETYTYDANGNQLSYTQVSNGSTSTSYSFTYDTNGNQIKFEEDTNGNGSIDYRETRSYDTNGALIRTDYDLDANNIIDDVITYTNILTPVGWSIVF